MTHPNDQPAAPSPIAPGDPPIAPALAGSTAIPPPPAAGPAPAAVFPQPVPMLAGRRQFARTTPVVVDRGRATFGLPSFGDRRQLGQVGLVVLMVLALAAILIARPPGSPGAANGGSPTPHGSATASAHPSSRPSGTPAPTPAASSSSRPGSPAPSPSAKVKTYTVKAGDTLSSIAAKFHTTAKIIEQINALKSPFVIHPGQVLKLP